jgi:hypothetical protein
VNIIEEKGQKSFKSLMAEIWDQQLTYKTDTEHLDNRDTTHPKPQNPKN